MLPEGKRVVTYFSDSVQAWRHTFQANSHTFLSLLMSQDGFFIPYPTNNCRKGLDRAISDDRRTFRLGK